MRNFLIISGLALASLSAHAAFIHCDYREEPCDEDGNHYFCFYWGWKSGEFCSKD